MQPVVGARGMDSATCSGGQLGVWIVQPVVGARGMDSATCSGGQGYG